jgi:hypothetical protein
MRPMNKFTEGTTANAIFAAIAGAIASAIIGRLLPEKISLNYWWIVVIGGFIASVGLYVALQQRRNQFPFIKFRVTNTEDGKGLWATGNSAFEGKSASDGGWTFKAAKDQVYPIHGPKLRKPLPPGKYRAIYRLTVHSVDVKRQNRYLLKLEALAEIVEGGSTKLLAGRTLTTYDFDREEEYKDFNLDFEILAENGELRLELCIKSYGTGIRLTLHYVQLLRR